MAALKAVVVSGIVFFLGGSLQAGAQSRGMMLAGRFFAGFSIGMLVSVFTSVKQILC